MEDQHVKSNGVKGAPTFNAACTKCGNGIKFWSINKDYMVIKWNEENPVKVGCTVLEDAQFENIISLFNEKKAILKDVKRFSRYKDGAGDFEIRYSPYIMCPDYKASEPFRVGKLFAERIAVVFIESCEYRLKKIEEELKRVHIKDENE